MDRAPYDLRIGRPLGCIPRLQKATSATPSLPPRAGVTSKQGQLLTRIVNTPPEMSSRNLVASCPAVRPCRTPAAIGS